MKYKAEIKVMPLEELLDPQGKAVTSGLRNLGIQGVDNVRVGKHIQVEVKASSKEQAEELVQKACEKLLANPVIEDYDFEVSTLSEQEAGSA
jgi:phosphoribosylformylglycinamidine synthase